MLTSSGKVQVAGIHPVDGDAALTWRAFHPSEIPTNDNNCMAVRAKATSK
jgi:hypothetical protein